MILLLLLSKIFKPVGVIGSLLGFIFKPVGFVFNTLKESKRDYFAYQKFRKKYNERRKRSYNNNNELL